MSPIVSTDRTLAVKILGHAGEWIQDCAGPVHTAGFELIQTARGGTAKPHWSRTRLTFMIETQRKEDSVPGLIEVITGLLSPDPEIVEKTVVPILDQAIAHEKTVASGGYGRALKKVITISKKDPARPSPAYALAAAGMIARDKHRHVSETVAEALAHAGKYREKIENIARTLLQPNKGISVMVGTYDNICIYGPGLPRALEKLSLAHIVLGNLNSDILAGNLEKARPEIGSALYPAVDAVIRILKDTSGYKLEDRLQPSP